MVVGRLAGIVDGSGAAMQTVDDIELMTRW